MPAACAADLREELLARIWAPTIHAASRQDDEPQCCPCVSRATLGSGYKTCPGPGLTHPAHRAEALFMPIGRVR
jgi:hypothetical protein